MFYKFRLKKIRESYLSILAAILPFAVFGFALIFGEIPHEWNTPIWFQSLSAPLFLGTVVISAAGFCLGWIKGFPRWTFPYIGLLILFSLFMTRVTTPGFLFDREVIDWRAWIPLLIAAVLALLITRFSNPLDSLFNKFSEDLSLITFGMFGFMPLLVMVIYDEMDRLYSLYFMVLITLIMIGTVIAYMSVQTQKRRNLSISAGIFLTISTTVIGPSWYWYLQIGESFWTTVIMGVVVYIILLLPVLVGILRKEKK